jgi:hypothetical protein
MANHLDLPEFPELLDEEPDDTLWAKVPPLAVRQAMNAIERLCSGELEYVVGHASLAGLDTAVILAITPGGLIPLFAHVTPDIFPVLGPGAEGNVVAGRGRLS